MNIKNEFYYSAFKYWNSTPINKYEFSKVKYFWKATENVREEKTCNKHKPLVENPHITQVSYVLT